MQFKQELDLLIRSRYPILYIPTPEEDRSEQLITEMVEESTPSREVRVWDFVSGLDNGAGRTNPVQALSEVEAAPFDVPALFIMRDFHRFLDDVQVSRKLRNLARHLRQSRKTLIILAPVLRIPQDIAEDVTVLDLAPPSAEEIGVELESILQQVPVRLTPGGHEALIKACQGLMMNRIRLGLARAVASTGRLDERATRPEIPRRR